MYYEHLELLFIAGGSVKWKNHCGKHWQILIKLKLRVPYDVVILLLGVYPREMEA